MRKRLIFTDGLKNKFAFQEYEEGVYAIIGPFACFTADEAFQDELTELCMRYNHKHGHLSKIEYKKRLKDRGWTAEELMDSCCPDGCRFTPCRAIIKKEATPTA